MERLNEIFEGKKLKTRTERHPGYPERIQVPEEKVDWEVDFPEYNPPEYTAKTAKILKKMEKGEADPFDVTQVDFTDRTSFSGPLKFDTKTKMPKNPWGRTGIEGRGLMGKWGPNHAADPMITRFNEETDLLEMLAIKRGDNGEWAFPGGKLDKGEPARAAAVRELNEEALDPATEYKIEFRDEEKVFEGVQDDPRNTDNAWFEAAVFHKHLSESDAQKLKLRAADDAIGVQWLSLTPENIEKLFAGHGEIVKAALQKMEREAKAGINPIQEAIKKALGQTDAQE